MLTIYHLEAGVVLEAKALRNHEIWRRSKQYKIEMHIRLRCHGNKWEWKHVSRREEITRQKHFSDDSTQSSKTGAELD